MADGYRQGIGGVGLGQELEVEKEPNHLLDLFLLRPAVSHQGLFHCKGRVLGNRQSGIQAGQHGDTPHVAEL